MRSPELRYVALLLAVLTGFIVLEADPAVGVEPDEILADRMLEARARDISSQLRCLVCRNESIDESDADLARDLRLLVRERIQLGESDDDVIAYIRDRYGDYVLLKPPLKLATLLLWGGPFVLFMIGVWLGWYRLRRSLPPPAVDLGPDEQSRVHALLKTAPEDDQKQPSDDLSPR